MTGYARRSRETPWGNLQLELRSVNHRYLDLSLRLGDELRALEGLLRDKLRQRLGRGKIEANLRLVPGGDAAAGLPIDDAVLDQLITACERIAAKQSHAVGADPLNLLRWPGVLREPELDLAALSAELEQLTDEALDELCALREAEGERMAQVLAERLDGIAALVDQVTARLPAQAEAWQDKLAQRLAEVSDVEPERREQIVAQFLQRLDVDEEIERLKSHCTAVRDTLARPEPVGRKLDFFMQEFNREANTLGSKSMDAELTRLAVELKVLIEQMREQVQNIE